MHEVLGLDQDGLHWDYSGIGGGVGGHGDGGDGGGLADGTPWVPNPG